MNIEPPCEINEPLRRNSEPHYGIIEPLQRNSMGKHVLLSHCGNIDSVYGINESFSGNVIVFCFVF